MHDPFGRIRPRLDLDTMTGRVAATLTVANRLVDGELGAEGVFLGSAILSWAAGQGDLVSDCLRCRGPAGSHRTAAWIARQLASSTGQQTSDSGDTVAPSTEPEGTQT